MLTCMVHAEYEDAVEGLLNVAVVTPGRGHSLQLREEVDTGLHLEGSASSRQGTELNATSRARSGEAFP